MTSVRFHPLADEELVSAIDWYLLPARVTRALTTEAQRTQRKTSVICVSLWLNAFEMRGRAFGRARAGYCTRPITPSSWEWSSVTMASPARARPEWTEPGFPASGQAWLWPCGRRRGRSSCQRHVERDWPSRDVWPDALPRRRSTATEPSLTATERSFNLNRAFVDRNRAFVRLKRAVINRNQAVV